MNARLVRGLAILLVGSWFLAMGMPARAEWPLDFMAPGVLRDGPGEALVLEGDTGFYRFLTQEIRQAGHSYLELTGLSLRSDGVETLVEVEERGVSLLADDGTDVALPTSAPKSLPLSNRAWSVLTWQLLPGDWTRDVRLIQVLLTVRLGPGTRLTHRGVEFGRGSGQRLGWKEVRVPAVASADQRTTELRMVHASEPSRVRRVSLWLRGSGHAVVRTPEVRAIEAPPALMAVECGKGPVRQVLVPDLHLDPAGLRATKGVKHVTRLDAKGFAVTLGPRRGWQSVSLPLSTRARVQQPVYSSSAIASIRILDIDGASRFALEEYVDATQQRIGWHEAESTDQGSVLTYVLQPHTDRLGFWVLRKDRAEGRLDVDADLAWRFLLTDVPLQPDRTSCVVRPLGGGPLEISRARFGFRVESDSLARARFSQQDAKVAGGLLLLITGSSALAMLIARRQTGRRKHEPSSRGGA